MDGIQAKKIRLMPDFSLWASLDFFFHRKCAILKWKNNKHMKPRILFASVFAAAFIGILFIAPSVTIGQASYIPLEQIPGAAGATTLPDYISGIYKFGIWTVGIAALFMLTIGGFVYMTSGGNTATLSRAKGYISDALIGLILALLAYLILNVINPDLVNLNLSRFSAAGGTVSYTPSQPSGGAAPDFVEPAPPIASAKAAAVTLLGATNVTWGTVAGCNSNTGAVLPKLNIQETSSGASMTTCHKGCNTTTSLCNGKSTLHPGIASGLSQLATTLKGMNPSYGFTVTSIAGGSHSTNSTHYKGTGVDIVPTGGIGYQDMVNVFNKLNTGTYAGKKPLAFCDKSGKFVPCSSGPNHIHIQVQ